MIVSELKIIGILKSYEDAYYHELQKQISDSNGNCSDFYNGVSEKSQLRLG